MERLVLEQGLKILLSRLLLLLVVLLDYGAVRIRLLRRIGVRYHQLRHLSFQVVHLELPLLAHVLQIS